MAGPGSLPGNPPPTAADLRRTRELWAKLPSSDPRCASSGPARWRLAGLGQDANSGVTAAEAAAFADQAVATPPDATSVGWARREELKEPDFNQLRGREDFQKLAAELEKKAEPKK